MWPGRLVTQLRTQRRAPKTKRPVSYKSRWRSSRGRRLARWSANHKHTDLMQARAWFTRGLAALLLAGLAAGICRATASASAHSGQTSHVSTTAVTPPHIPLGGEQ